MLKNRIPPLCLTGWTAAAGFLLLCAGALPLKAASAPTGTDRAITIDEDTSYVLKTEDFGFADPGDAPPDAFFRVKLTTLPAAGRLIVGDRPAEAGEHIPMVPVPGYSWTASGENRQWKCMASSADGSRLVAGTDGGQLYTSQDGGLHWTARETDRGWSRVASSWDGSILAATAYYDGIYISTDFGVTWTQRQSWRESGSIASSADGRRLAAVAGGQIYLSRNTGETWTAARISSSLYAYAVASSADGLKLAAVGGNGVHTSTDGGLTWTERASAQSWSHIASSADGSCLLSSITANSSTRIYLSRDSGVSWAPVEIQGNVRVVACSADGLTLAVVEQQRLHVSVDGGRTWQSSPKPKPWESLALSADAQTLVAGVWEGPVQVSKAAVPELTFTPGPDGQGQAYASFTFQVGDDGGEGSNLDPLPNKLTFNVRPLNDAPRPVSGRLAEQSAGKGIPFSLQMPAETFTDPDSGQVLAWSATLADGGALPAWLVFNPATRTFSGTPGQDDSGLLRIKVTVADNATPPLSGSTAFDLIIASPPAGTDGSVTLVNGAGSVIGAGAFGFTDPQDSPPNTFRGVRLTTLPDAGVLSLNGVPVKAGAFIPMTPVAGVEWTPRSGVARWRSVATSADGLMMLAVTGFGGASNILQTSSDAGVTWTQRGVAENWISCASSADGRKLVAVAESGYMHTSANGGVDWTPRDVWRFWNSVASSADGVKLVASASWDHIYTSTDSGVTWTRRGAVADTWGAVATTADGGRILAAAGNAEEPSRLFLSTDSGETWNIIKNFPDRINDIRCTPDGSVILVAGSRYRALSRDSGFTWRVEQGNVYWSDAALSKDGRVLAVVSGGPEGKIRLSLDSGITWTEQGPSGAWSCIALSADGSRMVAGMYDGLLCTSASAQPALLYTPPAGGLGAFQTSLTFQVEDNGPGGLNLDSTPNRLTLNVAPVNNAPVVDGGVPDLTAAKGGAFSWQVPAGIFLDPGDSLTFTATLTDGGPLPAWLSFSPATLTFSGTPGGGDHGMVRIRLTATDTGSQPLSASVTFSLTVPGIPPAGTDRTLVIHEDAIHTFSADDFGFTDPGDHPPHLFSRVKVTALPASGALTVEGVPVAAGDYVAQFPDARMVWTPHENERAWRAVASSADGVRLAAIDHDTAGGLIYTSDDSGATWTPRESPRAWQALASSQDGQTLIAAEQSGGLYISHDSGVVWTRRESAREWTAVACSADGTRLAAVTSQGEISTSTDSGITWTSRTAPSALGCLACSADGLRLVAGTGVNGYGPLHVSLDGGMTWKARGISSQWQSVASSADGVRLIAAALNGRIYISQDSGTSWTPGGAALEWSSVASSADGVRLVAVGNGGIHTSTDSGLTWSVRERERDWRGVASSADGLKLIAGAWQGRLYTSVAAVPELVFSPAADAFGTSYAFFTFQVEDDGMPGSNLDGTARTLTLSVLPVNDPPTLDPVPDLLSLLGNPGLRTVPLTGITAGGESQDLILTAVSDNPAVIPHPVVNHRSPETGGSLSFTPSSPAHGSATIMVTVRDSGGTANGGADTLVRTFTVRHTTPFLAWAAQNGLPEDPGADGGANLIRFASGLSADASAGGVIQVEYGRVLQRGLPALLSSGQPGNPEFRILFGRRKESGLEYLPQFSADLVSWETPDTAPAVVADDGLIEACTMPFPDTLITGRKPRFLRLMVRDSALMK